MPSIPVLTDGEQHVRPGQPTTPPMPQEQVRRLGIVTVPNVLLTTLNMAFPGHPWLALAWIASAVVTVLTQFGVHQVAHPSVLTFGLGVLPSALSLAVVGQSSYSVSSDVLVLTWFTLGTFVLVTTWVGRPAPPQPSDHQNGSSWMARLGALGLVAVSAVSILFLTQRGVPLLQFNAEQARVDASVGAGPSLIVIHVGSVIAAVALTAAGASSRPGRRMLWLIPIVLAVSLPALTGSRSAVLNGLFGAMAAAIATRPWKHVLGRLLAVAGLGVLVAWVVGEIRYSGGESSFAELSVQRLAADPYSATLIVGSDDLHFAGLDVFRTAFATYLPGAQPLVGDVLKDRLGLDFVGGAMSVPLAAEAVLIGGIPFIFVWAVVGALVPAYLQRWLVRTVDSRTPGTHFSLLLGILAGLLWAGVYGSGIATVVATYVVPATVLLATLAAVSHPTVLKGAAARILRTISRRRQADTSM